MTEQANEKRRRTIYLERELDRWVRVRAIEREMSFSDVIAEAVECLRAKAATEAPPPP